MNKLADFLKDESGATAIEYGLLAALIGVGLIVSMKGYKNSLEGVYNEVDTAMQNPNG